MSHIRYGKELNFLKSLILSGKWQDAELFARTIFENIQPEQQVHLE